MRNKKYLLLLIFAITVFSFSCEKEITTDGVSRITYYPDFVFNGEAEMFIELDTEYVEAGVTATESGQDIPVTTTVVGHFRGTTGTDVDVTAGDEYILTYSAENSDGYSGAQTRNVWVVGTGDLVSSIEGLYRTTCIRNGDDSPQYIDMGNVMIFRKGADTYGLSHSIGGYYAYGRGYGDGYRGNVLTITANDIAAGDFSFDTPGVGPWGGAVEVSLMSVDPAAGTVYYECSWFGYSFEITLTQVQI